MDIQAYKLSLIEQLLRINDEKKLQEIGSSISKAGMEPWDLMSEGEREAFREGLKDIQASRTVSYEDADADLFEKFPQLATK